MYQIIEKMGVRKPHTVCMSFILPYNDWCILEKTEVFRLLTEYLDAVEKRDNPNMNQNEK